MKIQINFKDLKHRESMDKKIRERTEKMAKIFGENPLSVNWTFTAKEGGMVCDVKFVGPSFEYHATGHSDNFFKTLDLVAQKIERQVKKKKSKWKDHKHMSDDKALVQGISTKKKVKNEDSYDGYEDWDLEEAA